jgi:hypothetical protein
MASLVIFVLALAKTANAQIDYMGLLKTFSLQPLPVPSYEYDGLEFRYESFCVQTSSYVLILDGDLFA